jgi:hypothetical protein
MNPELEKASNQLRKLIEDADVNKIREFCKTHSALCNTVAQELVRSYKGLDMPFAVKRLVEALQGMKEGALANSVEEQNRIMSYYVPSDNNLRNLPWYRLKMGGAWITYQLGSPWDRVLPGGVLHIHTFVCPVPGNLPNSYYPVPDLAFSPLQNHQIIKCEQVVKKVDGQKTMIDGGEYNKLSRNVKVNITVPPIFDK